MFGVLSRKKLLTIGFCAENDRKITIWPEIRNFQVHFLKKPVNFIGNLYSQMSNITKKVFKIKDLQFEKLN
jgi:hypothetical protein